MKILYCIIAFIGCAFCSASQIITTIAGNGVPGFSGEGGLAIYAEFNYPAGITTDRRGNIYVADFVNNVIQKIDTNGILTRFAGTGASGDMGDGGPATAAQLNLYVVVGLYVDSAGVVYIACAQKVRKVNTSGVISTVAGNGVYGSSGNGGPATACEFKSVTGLSMDKMGNLFIADEQSSNIRMVNTSGIISTFAGTTIGFSGDGGPATNAQLKTPQGITIDDSGNLFIADATNQRIRKVDKYGIITSVAGGNPFDYSCCIGCLATAINLDPDGIVVDHSGNLYVADIVHDVVQKITPAGQVYSFAGNCTAGYFGDGGPASTAELHNPTMICMDNYGNLLITDKGNGRYRKVWIGTNNIPPVYIRAGDFSIYPNPVTHKNFTVQMTTNTNEEAKLSVRDILGRQVLSGTFTTNTPTDFSVSFPSGLYTITAITKENRITKKLVIQ